MGRSAAGTADKKERKAREPKTAEQVITKARNSINRAVVSVVQLHIKARDLKAAAPIMEAADALEKALVAPAVTAETPAEGKK